MIALSTSLHMYELVLLILGVLLFLILCGAMIFFIIKKEPIKKLFWFFPISIIMIGYPSIQEIQIENDKISLTKYSQELEENPDDEETREKLEELVVKVENRAFSSEDMKSVSKAYLLLEQPENAIDFANKAISEREKELETPNGNSSDESGNDRQMESLSNIITLASIQKDIEEDPKHEADTARIRSEILKMESIDPGTKEFFNRKYLRKQ